MAIAFAIALVFGVQAAVTFPAAGLVAVVDEQMHGCDASIGRGMSWAFARFGPLVVWSAIQTVVSVLIGAVRGNGQGNIVVVLLRNVVAATADVLWQLITFLVLPVDSPVMRCSPPCASSSSSGPVIPLT